MYKRTTKTCSKCGKRRALEQFTLYRGHEVREDSLVRRCMDCRRAATRGYQKARAIRTNYANAKLAYAVSSGKIVRGECVVCAKFNLPAWPAAYQRQIDGHHTDYRKPYEVTWLCYEHHAAWHRVFKTEDKQD